MAAVKITGSRIASGLGMGSARIGGDAPEWRSAVRRIEPHQVDAELHRIQSGALRRDKEEVEA